MNNRITPDLCLTGETPVRDTSWISRLFPLVLEQQGTDTGCTFRVVEGFADNYDKIVVEYEGQEYHVVCIQPLYGREEHWIKSMVYMLRDAVGRVKELAKNAD